MIPKHHIGLEMRMEVFLANAFFILSKDERRVYRLFNQIERVLNNGNDSDELRVCKDEKLREAARLHAKDMLERGYFSHYTPEGISPFDRMEAANVAYKFAGENLAFAPDIQIAMNGLMKSQGHRDNILSPNFRKAGIGVLDAGIFGKIFVQEFTD